MPLLTSETRSDTVELPSALRDGVSEQHDRVERSGCHISPLTRVEDFLCKGTSDELQVNPVRFGGEAAVIGMRSVHRLLSSGVTRLYPR